MKKLLIILLALSSFNAISQSDSTKDTVAILTLPQVNEIVGYIQIQASGKADVKPEMWNAILQGLYKSVIIRTIPKKEKPKK